SSDLPAHIFCGLVLLPPIKYCRWTFKWDGFSCENVPCIKNNNLAPVYVKNGLFLDALEQTRLTFCTFTNIKYHPEHNSFFVEVLHIHQFFPTRTHTPQSTLV